MLVIGQKRVERTWNTLETEIAKQHAKRDEKYETAPLRREQTRHKRRRRRGGASFSRIQLIAPNDGKVLQRVEGRHHRKDKRIEPDKYYPEIQSGHISDEAIPRQLTARVAPLLHEHEKCRGRQHDEDGNRRLINQGRYRQGEVGKSDIVVSPRKGVVHGQPGNNPARIA